ncbi:MAG: ABC transporter substrate-binding protein [Gaiellales bacterium]
MSRVKSSTGRLRVSPRKLITSSAVLVLAVVTALTAGLATAGNRASATPLVVGVTADVGSWDQDGGGGYDPTAAILNKATYLYPLDWGTKKVAGGLIQDPVNVAKSYAQTWTSSENGKVWTLKLKAGRKWPSGNPVTAQDFYWSAQRGFGLQRNVAGIYRLIGLSKISQVTVVDPLTIRYTQDYPSALSTQIQLIGMFIYDSKLLKEHVTASDPWALDWAGKNPQVGGAYLVSNRVPGQSITLQANPDFPLAVPTKQMVLRVIPSSASMRLQLQKGDIDVASSLTRRDILQLKGKPGIKIISAPSAEQVSLPINMTMPPFNDVHVRRAMAWATPYDQIVKTVYGGDARRANSYVPLDTVGNSPIGYPYTYNVAKAKAEMALSKVKKGFRAELIIPTGDDAMQQTAILLANSLKQIGINLVIRQLDPATLSARRGKKDIPLQLVSGSFWVSDVEYALAVSYTEKAFINYSQYVSPVVEAAYTKLHTVTNQAARVKLAKVVQAQMAKDVPALMIAQPNFNVAVRSSIGGWVQPIDGIMRLRYLTKKG